MQIHTTTGGVNHVEVVSGNGHHGVDAVGMASVRSGKGVAMGSLYAAGAQAVRIA